jgi:hypothetical protein
VADEDGNGSDGNILGSAHLMGWCKDALQKGKYAEEDCGGVLMTIGPQVLRLSGGDDDGIK